LAGGSVSERDTSAEPAVAADGAGMTAFRGLKSIQPAPLLNFIVRRAKLSGSPERGVYGLDSRIRLPGPDRPRRAREAVGQRPLRDALPPGDELRHPVRAGLLGSEGATAH